MCWDGRRVCVWLVDESGGIDEGWILCVCGAGSAVPAPISTPPPTYLLQGNSPETWSASPRPQKVWSTQFPALVGFFVFPSKKKNFCSAIQIFSCGCFFTVNSTPSKLTIFQTHSCVFTSVILLKSFSKHKCFFLLPVDLCPGLPLGKPCLGWVPCLSWPLFYKLVIFVYIQLGAPAPHLPASPAVKTRMALVSHTTADSSGLPQVWWWRV